ncbi:MAG: hypothetical protein OMM_07823 [Candidatus Magnetoglobus multicellularis str. Araruama]|uniref:Uncharacterized protein n=1 Tax=Candidatus Magnetoglobus multicellularis str. Araruama TaxID=890399 RepID=A0A1V1PAX0_9BACT|nr:MAG: hypothetical protein OMM_07823 [Candidatus Magnetoglobus multicellularis str. Araruama]
MLFENEMNNLKNILIKETNFSKIWDAFMTHIAESHKYAKYTKKTKHPVLKSLIEAIGREHIFKGQEINITNFFLQKIKGTKLVHGPFLINNCFGNVFYYDDIDKGLISVCGHDGMSLFYRITSSNITNKKDRSKKKSTTWKRVH